MHRFIIPAAVTLTAGLVAALPAAAQVEVASDGRRVVQMTVYGTDPCPPSNDGEIVVCRKLPEEQRYRLPRDLRDPTNPKTGRSWSNQGDSIREEAAASSGGIGSCSNVGPGGATGCNLRNIRANRAMNQEPEPITVLP